MKNMDINLFPPLMGWVYGAFVLLFFINVILLYIKTKRKTTLVLGFVYFVITSMIWIWVYVPSTIYSANYTSVNFVKIQTGDSEDTVYRLLGEPLYSHEYQFERRLFYSEPGESTMCYLVKIVIIDKKNCTVKSIINRREYD